MEASTITFDDVLTFIRGAATESDLDRFEDTARQRTRTLNEARAAALAVGQPVRLDRYQDARLNGLTGTVEHIERTRGKATYAAVRLDETSTLRLRKHQWIPEEDTEHETDVVPLTACYPVSGAAPAR